MRNTAYLVAALAVAAGPAAANPVPDAVAEDFRGLVATTAATGVCPRPDVLVAHFAAFGLGLLSSADIESIDDHFGVFAPLLVRSQDVNGGLDFRVQELYRAHADAEQRTAMVEVLRHWLTADIQEAPRQGTMRIDGPPSAVQREIEGARTKAAELLLDWDDGESTDLIDDLLSRPMTSEGAQRRLRAVRARFQDPCAGRLVGWATSGPVERCGKRTKIVSAALRERRQERLLTVRELDSVWKALSKGTWDENSHWAGSLRYLTIRLSDGSTATLSPTEPGRLTYHEDSTYSPVRRTMSNRELFDLVVNMTVATSP